MENLVHNILQYWPLKADTLGADASGNGNDGTVTNATFTGANGGGYIFSGSGPSSTNRIVSNTAHPIGSAYTVWVRGSWNGVSFASCGLWNKRDNYVTADMRGSLAFNSTAGTFSYTQPASSGAVWSPGVIAGTIYDWVLTYNGTQAAFYQNGVQIGTAINFTQGTDDTAAIVLGGADATGQYGWEGTIYEYGLWTRVLTPAQIAAITSTGVAAAVQPVTILSQRDKIGYYPAQTDVKDTAATIFDHHPASGRHLRNAGLIPRGDYLESAGGVSHAYTSYNFMDDMSSGRPSSFYIEAWFPTLSATFNPLAGAYDDDNTSDRSWVLGADNVAGKVLYSANGVAQSSLSTSNAPVANVWNRLLYVWDGTTLRVGLHNGTTVGTGAVATAISPSFTNLYVGSYHDGTVRQYLPVGARVRNFHQWARGLQEVERLGILHNGITQAKLPSKEVNIGLIIGQSNGLAHEVISWPNPITSIIRGNAPHPQSVYQGLRPKNWVYERGQTLGGLDLVQWRRAIPRDDVSANGLGIQTGLANGLGPDWHIINMAVGATGIDASFNQWQSDDVYYQQALAGYQRAIGELVALGYTPVLKVISIFFGETDGNTSAPIAAAYLANYADLVDRLRTDFGDVDVVINDLPAHSTVVNWLTTVRAAHASLSASLDRAHYKHSDYPLVIADPADHVHITGQGNFERGLDQAELWEAIAAGQLANSGTVERIIQVTGATIINNVEEVRT